MLPRRLDASFEGRWMDLQILGTQRQPETGGCPLLLRPDGSFWKVAGCLVKVSGQLNGVAVDCGWRLQVGWFSGQRGLQVFVVAGKDGGGLLG